MFSRLNGARFVRPWKVPSTRPALTLRQTGVGIALAALASYPLAIQTEALTTSAETVVQKVRPAAVEMPNSGRGANAGDKTVEQTETDASSNERNFARTFDSRAGPLRSAFTNEINVRRISALPAPAPQPPAAQTRQPPASAPTIAQPLTQQSAAKRPALDEEDEATSSAAPAGEAAEARKPTEKRGSSAKAPTACLPTALKDVLSDVEALFGKVTIVSTTRLHTENHARSSVREKLHAECKAVDFRTLSATKDVIAYLRTRREIAGINSYRNNVVHIDHSGRQKEALADSGRKTPKKKAPRRKSRQA